MFDAPQSFIEKFTLLCDVEDKDVSGQSKPTVFPVLHVLY